MININFCKKKLIASILCANTIFLTMPVNVYASEISGITPTGNTYNIEAAKVSGSTGFRQYEKFNLTKGDIANLKFKDNYSKFVNLVDNQININGIVNTMKGNSFYNGHVIFVSPNGMVIGASGLLNVGSLSVLTPTQANFNSFKNAYDANNLSSYEYNADKYKELIKNSKGDIVVNGKILAREEVNLYGKNIKIEGSTNRAGIIAGWDDEDTSFDDLTAAENTFNSLVSNNITNANSFSLNDGAIQIVAKNESGFADAAGNIKAEVNIKNADIGANDIDISSTAKVDRQERIDLAEAKVNVEDSKITGDTVALTAEATQKKGIDSASITDNAELIANTLADIFGGTTPSVTSLWGVAGKADANVTVKNSTLTALKAVPHDSTSGADNSRENLSVLIHAEASSETSENANLLTPAIIDILKSEEAKIGEFFSSSIYNGFEGAKSSATVNVDNSTINATAANSKNVEISTEASSSLDANNRVLAFVMPVGLYGVGTETESKAIVTASTLNVTKGDIDVNAISSNSNEVNITNDGLLSYTLEDALLAVVLNNTVKSTTEASVNSSTVNSKNLTVFAANLSKSQAEIGLEAKAGTTPNQGGNGQGNSAASISGILNRSNNNIKALIKDSTVKTSEDTIVLAQSLNKISNSADATIKDKMTEDKKTLDQGIKDKLKETKDKYLNKTLFNMIKGHTSVKADQAATAEAGGVLIWNNTNNTTTAKIENSNVTAGNVTVQANTVDLLSNGATSDAAGEGKFGVGLSVIYNDQYNTTNANISGSTIKADNVTVDATTELPMNQGELTFGFKLPFKVWGYEKIYFGGKLASEPNGKWDISGVKPEPDKEDGDPDFELTGIAEQNLPSTYEDLKPKFRFEGFFNNLAQSAANGTNAAISGSVIYNEIINNTTAEITNGSDITIKEATGDNPQGALTVNAVNSVIGYNAAGLIDFLVKQINYKIPGQPDEKYEPTLEAGRFGLGVNFLWDNYTNNSIAKIDNSKVTAEKGTVNVDAATEQAYITANMTGAKSEAFGIDGSINVQKIKGDTNALISNITGDNEIKAEDISLNAGKAHIKTTAGNIKRDKDTNQIEWKVQDPSAQGDEKYIREAHDEITNIIAQGAWVSQYEEVDNTVQENSQGVAIGTSVTVSDVDRTVKAAIKNATVTSTNDITLNADTYNQKIDVEVAAAFSGGVTQKAAEVEDVQADANAAQDDEDNIFGNLFENEDEYMRNPVGNKLSELQGQFSMSIAGAVDVTTDSTKVEASISDSTVNAGNKLDVKAHRESKNINVDGGLGKSKKVGAGLAANYYNQNGSVKSYIDNSTVKFSGDNPALKVDATNKNWILDIAIGAGAAVNSAAQGKGFQAAIGGSASINTLKPTIEAYINKSTIKDAAGNTNSITTTLNAKNDVDIISISGGGSYVHGGTSGLSAGAAFNYNNIKNTISTYIKDSTLENIGALSLLADADNNLNDFAVAAAIVTGSEGGFNFNFAGGADVDYIHDTVSSKIENSTITADNDISIKANSKSENLNVAGTFDYTTAQSGVGVNGDVSVNVYRNTVTSEIDKDSKILKAKDVKVAATSTEKSNVIPVGLSVATDKQFLMAAANVGVNVIDNTVKALVAGNVGTGDNSQAVNSLNVAAYDETTLYSRGGTVALAAAESIINLAGSFNIDILDKNVEAKILNNKVKSTGDVTVTATSINSMGGTKDSSGSYTRDDVTTDAYKEKMLNKNDKGEYVGLKQNSSFQNWNMFYDIAAGGHVSVAGGAIVKTIQNTVTAEVANSEIEANNLNVIANDYSIKNIIAGAVDASGKGSVGLQGLVTYDRSTTTALITNGSTLNIANTIDLEAINRKDNHQIMVAAGGAGKFSVNANIIYNNIIDKAIAKIDNGSTDKEIKAGTIKVNANEDMNASHIVVTGGGAGSVAVSVSPLINNYDGTVESVINNALIKDAAIDMDANNSIGTLDISVGVSGVGQGLAGTGIAIKNNYTNKVKSYIDNSVINTAKTIDIDANSVIDSNNWIASLAVTGQGVDVIVNVLLNNILSELEAGIKNTSIEKAGAITLNTNKDKKDVFANRAIGLGASGEGVSALVNVVQNIYDNKVKSYVENTSSEEIDSLSINSYSDKKFDNINFGMSFAGIGASILANALVNQIDSSTHSYIDAKSKELNVTNAISLNAKDNNEATNSMAMINVAGEGAAVGANINLYYADNLAKAEVLSNSDGQINAGSSAVNSELSNGLDNFNMSVSLGFGALAGDIALIKLGKRSDVYSQAEKDGNIKDAVDYTKDKYDKITAGDKINNKYTPTGSSSTLKTGAIASVKGNLETQNDTTIKAESKLKGLGLKEKLEITNTNVSAGIATVGVGVKDVQFANNTIAEIAGGTVKSTAGDVSVDAISKSNIGIKNVKVDVSGVTVSGGGAVYNNTSETLSQIKDATVNAKNINVISNSTSNSTLDSTNVVVSGGNIVAIDFAENKDTNKSSALITGNTNIDATGKLTLHSTVNTDLSSIKSTVKVEGANLFDTSKNEVNAGTINRAIIENVNGKITTNGLDIITDYDKLSSYSKANVTAVKLGDVFSKDTSGAFMNADFKSGIDSATGLTLVNSGDTNIITAKDNSTDAKGIVSKAEINNVHVSLQGFAASTSAKSENNAKAETVLKAKEHTAKNLNIDSYLNSIADSNAGSVKATVGIGVNVVSVDAKDTSNMNMVISGANTITQNAIINAVHTSNVNSDMSAFNFSGLIGGGQRVRIDSSLTANTTGNIGGDFNANSANISFNTTRNSVMSKSSGSGGGVVNVSDTKAKNTLTGSSTLNISGLNSDTQKGNNNLLVKNISTNTFDVTSSDGSGAIIAVSNNNIENNFTTTTTTNINNSDINSKNKVTFEVANNSIVKDTASMGAGGFIAVADTWAGNSYISTAKLALNNTEINAETIDLKSSSDIRTKNSGIVDYVGGVGGFIAENEMNLTNTITQTSEIDIKNSKLNANKDINLNTLTSSFFKQKTDSTVGGFVAMPRSKNWLNVTNNNKISVDETSKLVAGDELEIDFDSNNDLEARAISEAHHFGFRDPVSESYLTFVVNNTLQNNGSIEAGNLIDIDYMQNSINNLTQYAYSEAHAAIPTTTENGVLNKTINNVLNVTTTADITSGKDVDINYSSGRGTNSSTIAYKSVCYALFGIPITKTGSKSNINSTNSPALTLNGKIVAGQGNSKYMKINRDGTVDKESLKGFYDDDYTLYDGQQIDGEKVKEQNLASIRIEIDNIEESLTEVDETIQELTDRISEIEAEEDAVQEKLDEINNLIANGYELKNSVADAQGDSVFSRIIENDIKTLATSGSDSITENQFNIISVAYDAVLADIEQYNKDHPSAMPKPLPSVSDFFTNIDSYSVLSPGQKATVNGLSAGQKTNVANAYDTVYGNMTQTTKGAFTIYTDLSNNKYVSAINPSGSGTSQTCVEITQFDNEIANYKSQIKPYEDKKASNETNRNLLANKKVELETEYNEVYNTDPSEYEKENSKYAIVFNDVNPKSSHINIDGGYNFNISRSDWAGNGIFSVASNGLKIDNYSTRSLIFNDLNIDSNTYKTGLIIGGKNHSEFADKGQAVSGMDAYLYINNLPGKKTWDQLPTSGVHYKNGGDDISGITVNNYYDINHPFAETFDISNPTTPSSIFFTGDINTANSLNVWNESGTIAVLNDGINAAGKVNFIASNGAALLNISNSSHNAKLTLKPNDSIFAADGVFIGADQVDIKGNITTGYSDRSITITDTMLEESNLIVDPTSGEKNMINLGGSNITPYLNATNNIKAIYKDGQIYLYNVLALKQDSSITITDAEGVGSSQGSVTGTIKMADGYQNITIDNQTNKQLNIKDINNIKFSGGLFAENISTTGATITQNTKDHAETNITSTGKLSLNGIINNNLHQDIDVGGVELIPDPNGILNINAKNALDINEKTKAGKVIDSILAGGQVNITTTAGITNILGNITDKGNINILNNGTDKLNINADITDTEGYIGIQSNGQTEITKAITANLGDIYIASKGLNITEDSKITDDKGNVTITNNASALTLNGDIKALDGTILFTNNGDSANIGGYVTDENGDIVIVNTKGDMTISSYISHDAVNQSANGMISVTNDPAAGELNIAANIVTEGSGKTVGNDLIAILIDNQSTTKGLSLSETISARLGDIVIKNNVGNLSVSGSVLDNKGNINISNDSQTEISGEITAKEGNIGITSVGLDTTEDSIITTHKGDISINNVPYSLPDYNRAPMNLNGIVNNYNGSITIQNQGASAVVGGNIVDEKGNIFIINENGPMTVSADVAQNYLNQGEEGLISVTNTSFGEKLDITGNIINWGKGHKNDVTGITTAIDIYNNTSSSERTYISGAVSARIGDIAISNEHGKLITTSTAEISNTENGNINIENFGNNGADISGKIIATEGNIGIKNTKNDLYINADITEKKGDINITNSGKSLTYLGNTLNKLGDTNVINNGIGIAQIGASIDNTGNVTIKNNNGQNLVFDGEINNYGNTLITNNNGFVHIYGDITNEHGSTGIQNEGVFTEITSKINNDTGSIAISNRNGHLRITDTAEINNTSDRENSNITIVNYGADSSEPSNLLIDGNINSLNKGFVEIINNGDEAILTGDIFAKDGNIGVTNSNDGKLSFTGNIVDYKGNVALINNSDDGAEIGGTILDEQGDISIINNGGDLKVTSEITHNYVNRNAEGMISITNSDNAGSVIIDSVIATDGKGRTDDCGGVTAILIDNQSTAYGMSLNSTISARIGDIIIKNASEDLSTAGMISNYEQGNINITNGTTDLSNNGKDYTNTASIINKLGDVNITNNGTGMARVGGSINNQEGNTAISNKGEHLEVSGPIDNNGGNTTITNKDGQLRVVADVTNKGGDIQIANSGEFTEITSAIANEAGSVHISNSNGNLNITSTASITNTTDDAADSITIANAGDILNLDGTVRSLNKGDIEITNTGSGKANIAGTVTANEGDIDISNSNTGELNISGTVTDYNGNIDVTNESTDGAVITSTGKITNVKGDTTITNKNGDLTVQDGGQVINTESGNINAENKGGKFTIAGLFKHAGEGNISVKNSGNDELDITSTGKVLAENGNINIQNSNDGAMNIAGTVSDGKGNIDIINSSADGAVISGTVLDKEGNLTVFNAGGALDITGNVVDKNGDLKLVNNGLGGASISGTVLDEIGNLTVYNTAGTVDISGNVVDNKGKLNITNTADELTTISGTVNAKDGDATIYTNGGMALTDTGYIVDNKGNLSITNKGGDGIDISGTVLAKEGNATVYNDAGALDISGYVTDNKGDLKVINNGDGGADISGTILAKEGNTTIYNTAGTVDISGNVVDNKGKLNITNTADELTTISGTVNAKDGDASIYTNGGLTLTDTGYIVDNKGDLSITNKGGDGIDISGTILAKEGNATVYNDAGALDISGYVTDNKGDLKVINNGNGGTDISGTVLAKEGDTTVYNTAGALDISGYVTDNKGDLKVINNGDGGTDISGTVLAKEGDTTVYNTAGVLDISGNVVDENGNIDITNTGDDGSIISGIVLAKEGNVNILNEAGDFTISGTVKDEIGNIDINNNGGVAEISGTVLAQNGNIDVFNTNDGELSISGTIKDENGKINITNDSNDGTEISGNVTNVQDDTTITNNAGDLVVTETGKVTNTENGNIKAENNGGKFTIAGLLKHFGIGNIDVNNKGNGELEVTETGVVAATDGTININNENAGGIVVEGSILSDKGETNVNNKSEDGIFISTTGKINNQNGNINVTNTGKAGIDVQGSIRTEKQNINITNKDSDLRIGEYDSDNDNYITAAKDNVVINQTNGNILNSITDPATGKKHQNADLGNPDHAYKTLIATGKNLVINAQDGDIGSTSAVNPGFSIDANTRDYTESINVNVKGKVNANALNKNNADARLVNIRAKESDLKVENITSDGNIILTAADWKQPDTRPTPQDEAYFKGYSVLNAAQGDKSAVIGQNISVIASDRIGTEKKPFAFTQDTKNAPDSSVSFESENDVNILARSNSKKPTKINQLISKRGDVGLVLDDDGVIREITAGDHLHILQRAKNLTIYDLGMSHSGGGFGFNDMLYPHDGLKAGGGGGDSVVPQSVAIEVLDSKGGDSADSNLKIYSAAVKGRNNGQGAYDKNGRQIADISLMADNIYANSAKAPDSTVETKANPNGYKQTDKTYSDAEFGIKPSKTYDALGFNAYGPGTALSFDIKGVDKNFVKDNVPNATRTNYHKVYSVDDVTDKFKNDNNQIKDYDYKANNVVLSVNENVKTNRGVNINSIYADNAYVNSKDSKLAVQDGYITNYAEFRNRDKIAAVDNDYRRIVDPADIQLYTAKTGSFSLLLKDTINMHTTAPTVYNNPYMLVNGYHSAWNFVNRGRKEAEHQIENIQLADSLRKKYEEEDKRISMRFDTTDDEGLQSDVEIYDISSTGALIKNDRNLKKGDEITFNLKFDDVDTKVKAKVVNLKDDKAGVAFIKLPKAVASKILYRYMQQANSMKSNLTSSL